VNWENNGQELKNDKKAAIRNVDFYFKKSITWNLIGTNSFAARYSEGGALFEAGGSSLFGDVDLKVVLSFMLSTVAYYFLNILNPTINFSNGIIAKLPIMKFEHVKKEINELANKNIDISKKDWDDYEISWNYLMHPLIKELKSGNLISNIYIRNLYVMWEIKKQSHYNKLKTNEERLNSIFKQLYDIDEIDYTVSDDNITLNRADKIEDIKSLISYAVGCMLGRYSLDVEGLIYAGGEWDNSKYSTFIPDADNIIPITDEEYFDDDIVCRFVDFVKVVYGQDTLEENLEFIANALGGKGKSSREVIRTYFIKDFYKNHCKIYQKRPIYWLFDSGKQNGFKALIYMHRYDKDTVGRIRADYLHKTQGAIEGALKNAEYIISSSTSAVDRAKATKDRDKYIKQLSEIKIYDQAIAHVALQRIEIDLDDGVKHNYQLFQGVEVSSEGSKKQSVDLLAKI